MKIPYAILFFLFLIRLCDAQVPNGDFENWTGIDPDGWYTTNIPVAPRTIMQDSDAFTGSLCAKGVVVSNNQGQPFQPYLGYAGPAAQGFHISDPFTRFEGYCKLHLNPGDKFTGIVHIYNSNEEPIAEGRIAIDSSSNSWEFFSIEINYFAMDNSLKCSVFFTITDSTEIESGHIGSEFYLDYLTMSGFSSLGIEQFSENDLSVFPNVTTGKIFIKGIKTNNYEGEILDMNGRLIKVVSIAGENGYDVSELKPGMYVLRINDGIKNYPFKFIKE